MIVNGHNLIIGILLWAGHPELDIASDEAWNLIRKYQTTYSLKPLPCNWYTILIPKRP